MRRLAERGDRLSRSVDNLEGSTELPTGARQSEATIPPKASRV